MPSCSSSPCSLTARLRKCCLIFQEAAKLPKRLALRASPPLLLLPHERWKAARVKVPIVGQETRRWLYDPNQVGQPGNAINNFRDFLQAKDGVGAMWNLYSWYALGRAHPTLNSPFWRGFRGFDSAVNDARDAALWTNVFKVNVNGSVMKNCRAAEVAALQKLQFGLLREEIEILKPEVVVFFSGHRYDSTLRIEFPDMEILPFSPRMPASAVGIIRAAGLPERTIRTYHPEYLQRSSQLGLIAEISRWASGKVPRFRSADPLPSLR